MNFVFDLDLIVNISLGTILGVLLTAYFNEKKSKRDLCIQVYERWISSPLYQNRNEVLRQLKVFFFIDLLLQVVNGDIEKLNYLNLSIYQNPIIIINHKTCLKILLTSLSR